MGGQVGEELGPEQVLERRLAGAHAVLERAERLVAHAARPQRERKRGVRAGDEWLGQRREGEAAVVLLGGRVFLNISLIRRYLINELQLARKKEG